MMLQGDWIEVLRTLESESVHCVVTSPPYWGLRDYGTAQWEGGEAGCDHSIRVIGGQKQTTGVGSNGHAAKDDRIGKQVCACGARRIDQQLGLETTPEEYVRKMVEGFREVRRVLRKDGTLWLNLGDSYCSQGGPEPAQTKWQVHGASDGQNAGMSRKATSGLKPKDLVGIPWRVAFALQADGWYLRSDIIWHKTNPMPESVTDRPTKSHEYLFLLTKDQRYYYDAEAIKEAATGWNGSSFTSEQDIATKPNLGRGERIETFSRNRRTVWTIPTQPFPEAHFATFPEELVKPCILAGTSEKGVCVECGAPWERVVEASGGSIGHSWHDHHSDLAQGQRAENAAKGGNGYMVTTLGWRPTCSCGTEGLEPDDLEIINTPTGERAGDDPSLITGRAGMNRPRGDNEGSRPITRYEQRKYAEQLRQSSHRDAMASEAGEAFAHYVRIDRSGARPIPQELLDKWIAAGWLQPVELPSIKPPETKRSVVLDPFGGSGTVGKVAQLNHCESILIELNPAYIAIAAKRLSQEVFSW